MRLIFQNKLNHFRLVNQQHNERILKWKNPQKLAGTNNNAFCLIQLTLDLFLLFIATSSQIGTLATATL